MQVTPQSEAPKTAPIAPTEAPVEEIKTEQKPDELSNKIGRAHV
jgi:hypothetical protein